MKYTHSKGGTTVKLDLPDFRQSTRNLGIDKQGKVQAFVTKRAAHHMDEFVPMDTGTLKNTADFKSVPTQVTYVQDYASPMYFGVHPRTGTPLTYSHAPQRGAFWDEKMMAAKGLGLIKEVQEFSNRLETK